MQKLVELPAPSQETIDLFKLIEHMRAEVTAAFCVPLPPERKRSFAEERRIVEAYKAREWAALHPPINLAPSFDAWGKQVARALAAITSPHSPRSR